MYAGEMKEKVLIHMMAHPLLARDAEVSFMHR